MSTPPSVPPAPATDNSRAATSAPNPYLIPFQQLWVTSASSTFFVAIFQALSDPDWRQQAWSLTLLPMGYLLWLAVYFFVSATRNGLFVDRYRRVDWPDFLFDVFQSTVSFTAVGAMGFLTIDVSEAIDLRRACMAANSAIFLIAIVAGFAFSKAIAEEHRAQLQRCRGIAAAVAAAVFALLAATQDPLWVIRFSGVGLVLLVLVLGYYLHLRIYRQDFARWKPASEEERDQESGQSAGDWTSFREFFCFLWRLAVTIAFAFVAARAAWACGLSLLVWYPTLGDEKTLVSLIGASAILASVEKLATRAGSARSWIRSGTGEGPVVFAIFVFTGLLPICVWINYEPGADKPGLEGSAAAAVEGETAFAYSVSFTKAECSVEARPPAVANDQPRRFLLPFRDEAHGCAPDSEGFAAGKRPLPGVEDFLAQLVTGLLACAEEGKPVKLRVRGYASSAPFLKCADEKASDALNLRIANDRADVIVGMIEKAQREARGGEREAGHHIEIEREHWDALEPMIASRDFNDRDAAGYNEGRAVLTRRADLEVVDPAGCQTIPGALGRSIATPPQSAR
jgi:hypothetical protein